MQTGKGRVSMRFCILLGVSRWGASSVLRYCLGECQGYRIHRMRVKERKLGRAGEIRDELVYAFSFLVEITGT